MAKKVIKETIIVLLLMLAIILVLGVLLYGYLPMNKIIPETVSYTTPENVKSELQTDTSVDTENIVMTYTIDSTDLSNYKKVQEYVPGRKNPFATTEIENNTTTEGSTTTDGTTSSSSSNSGSQSSSSNSDTTASVTNAENSEGYIPNKGTK